MCHFQLLELRFGWFGWFGGRYGTAKGWFGMGEDDGNMIEINTVKNGFSVNTHKHRYCIWR